MKKQPKYKSGDTIRYKSGKRGYNYGFDNGKLCVVDKVVPPLTDPRVTGGEWGGWMVIITESNATFPAAWFELVVNPQQIDAG